MDIYSIINLIKEVQEENEATMRMLRVRSSRAPVSKTKYREINEKIVRLKRSLINNSIDLYNYIDSVSYLIHLED